MEGSIYEQRISLTVEYIGQHLTEGVPLDGVAQAARFSPYHFHRLFKAITGETVTECANRLRLERAAAMLRAEPRLSITEAALACGFSSASSFSRAFHHHFGLTARAWDRRSPLQGQQKREQAAPGSQDDAAEAGEFVVRVRDLPARWMACVRVSQSHQSHRVPAAYARLLEWYRGRGGDPLRAQYIGIAQDDPDVTPRLSRYDVCLTMPDDWAASGEVSAQVLPACRAATIHYTGEKDRLDRAWHYLYRHWLPHSPYQPDDLPALEIFRRQPAEIGWELVDVECAVPVVLLGTETVLEA